jgi:hypothetical protein
MYSLLWLGTDDVTRQRTANKNEFLNIIHISKIGALPEIIKTPPWNGLVVECGKDGKDIHKIVQSARTLAPDIPLVLVEGGVSREDITSAYLAGVDLVIPDDMNFSALLNQILQVLPVLMKSRMHLASTGETGRKDDLEFLRRSAMAFVDMGDDDNIYQYIGERIRELVPDAIVGVCSYDPVQRLLTLRTIVAEEEDMDLVRREGLGDIVGQSFPVNRDPSAEVLFQKNTLQETPSLYQVLLKLFLRRSAGRSRHTLISARAIAWVLPAGEEFSAVLS